MDRGHQRIHLVWGSIALLLATALGIALCRNCEFPGEPGATRQGVPLPQRAEAGFEDELADQLNAPGSITLRPASAADFPERLARAIGLSAFELAAASDGPVRQGEGAFVGGGQLTPLDVVFSRPAIHTRAWLWRHPEGASRLVVLLHGHNTTALRALGLADDDYMLGIGGDFFGWGADVLAYELSSDGVVSGYINARLNLAGGQLYGLWVTAVCGGSRAIAERGGYDEVVLYGMSNGGFVADMVSVLCDGFDRVIVDDILTDLPVHAEANTNKLFQHQQYSIYFLTPFLATLDYRDFLRYGRADKVYTRTKEFFTENLEKDILSHFRVAPLKSGSSLSIVFKGTAEHSPESKLLHAIVDGKLAALEGVSLRLTDDGQVAE